jgi:hypothetical protein
MDWLLRYPGPWYVAGPLVGLVIVALAATLGERIGILGGCTELVEAARGRVPRLGWSAWFLLGTALGGVVFALVRGTWGKAGTYSWLQPHLGSHPTAAMAVVLLGAGVLIGAGAKAAGGCTSGNGLGGTAAGSPASLVATVTFMATAVGATFLLRWLVGA